ncbi:MAG: hypothetical protein KAH32_01345 [Chlamydiia bacterium]|nr:hypothetical protein [Chlamydiia bacterium]
MAENLTYGSLNVIATKIKESIIVPAKKEAEIILKESRDKASSILSKAKEEYESIVIDAKKEQEKIERNVSKAIKETVVYSVNSIKKEILNSLSVTDLISSVDGALLNSDLAKSLVDVFILNITNRFFGEVSVDISAKNEELTNMLSKFVIDKLKNSKIAVSVGDSFRIHVSDGSMDMEIDSKFVVKSVISRFSHDVLEKVFGTHAKETIANDIMNSINPERKSDE